MHKASILCVPGATVQKDIKRRCTSPPMYDATPAHATLIDNMWQLHIRGGTGGSSRSVSWRWQETSRGMTAVLTIKQEYSVKVKRVNWDHVAVLFRAQYKQWVQVYTLNILMYHELLFSVYECLIGSYKSGGSTLIYQNGEVSATWGRKRIKVHIQMTTGFMLSKIVFL